MAPSGPNAINKVSANCASPSPFPPNVLTNLNSPAAFRDIGNKNKRQSIKFLSLDICYFLDERSTFLMDRYFINAVGSTVFSDIVQDTVDEFGRVRRAVRLGNLNSLIDCGG